MQQNFSHLTDKNTSYFLNLDTVPGAGSSLLSGDRNITNRASAWSRLVDITKGTAIAWNKEIHSEKGNLGFADGSVDVFTNQRVGAAIQLLAGITNRLAVP